MLNPWLGIALVLASLCITLAGLRTWQLHRCPDPERVRKGLHIMMSAVVLTFPWLFNAQWPVLVLTVLGLGVMGALRGLREGAGCVVHGVRRRSFGELWFPLAVGLLFLVTGDDPLRYGIPILVLGLADPAAALVGQRHGRVRYGARLGAKTAEGSLAFFAVATGAVLAPLLLTGESNAVGPALLVALFVGALTTLAEAVARRGLDNLLVPLVALLALETALGMETAELGLRLTTVAVRA